MKKYKDCFHCSNPNPPIWPITSLDSWVMDVCHAEAFSEAVERHYDRERKEIAKNDSADAKRAVEREEKRQEYIRDQRANRMRAIHERRLGLSLLNPGGTNNMPKEAKEKKVTKTGVLDALISENLEAAYQEGTKDKIVAQVMEQFPNEDAKRISGLYFSRRAVLKKASTAQAAA